jgi:small neutral amino acid transporter SnatA (MarC family)
MMVHAQMRGRIVEELITLFVVLNPIDAIPIFLTATARLDERDRQKTVFIAVFRFCRSTRTASSSSTH